LLALPCQALAASITETSAAIGKDCAAWGSYSTAMGYKTQAGNSYSTSMGKSTIASGVSSTAMGESTIASGGSSNAMGQSTKATGNNSTSMGYLTEASGYLSIAMGAASIAGGISSFAGGRYMQLTNTANYTFVWGDSTTEQPISASNAFLIFPAGATGMVGIGTKSPRNLFDMGTAKGKKLAVYQNTNGNDFYGFGIEADTLEIYEGVPSEGLPAMVVKKTTGRIGIGTVSPGYKLEVIGDAAKTSGGTTWINSSDVRLKDVTGEYRRGLNAITSLRPVTFFYKQDNPRGLPSNEENIGFIAQEVRKVFPEAVSEGLDGYLDFNMHPINVALVNTVKELRAENEALREEIQQIKAALGM